ncbi:MULTISPECIES: TOBE domain-containing protein [Aquimarina]|uniref:Tobe domain protein n=1 Tax=Aquimarina algiphila TaxID=2047982 RepID=A0A554VRR3_9FLAO|nr:MULTISPECIES: TOBE domain-containing protein [Aquimarina]TSE11354.1 tobe domain protein [Aquimarina algiphila]
MNILKGKITAVKTNGNLSLVEIDVDNISFKTIVVETPDTASYLTKGNIVKVIFKETEVIIGKGVEHAVSMQNKIVGKILTIENGELLSKLTIDIGVGNIVSIITTNAVQELRLQVDEKITAMIKTNEIMLSE